MKKSIIAAGALSLLTFVGCSDSNTAGNAVEPNAFAYNRSSSSNTSPVTDFTINFDEIFTFSTNATGKEQVGLALISTYKEENAAAATCTVKNQELTGIVKIKDNLITRAYSGNNLWAKNIDDFIYTLKKTCAYTLNDANKTIDSLVIRENSFDFACISGTDYMSIDEVLSTFESVMNANCKQLEIQDRLDSLDSAYIANTSEKIVFSDEDPNTEVVIDPNSRTLASYALQYAKPEELSFDSHVLAYNSNLSTDCFKAMGRYRETATNITFKEAPIMTVEKDVLPTCFPRTDSVADFSKRNPSCKYYLIGSNDAAQPTGHVLSKVSKETIETISINPGGTCAQNADYFTVHFLVEDCEGLISKKTTVINRGATSKRWKCEQKIFTPEDSTLSKIERANAQLNSLRPTTSVISYGEWYNESLLTPTQP